MTDAPPRTLKRSMRVIGALLLTLSAVTPASSVFIIVPQVFAQAGTGAFVSMAITALLSLPVLGYAALFLSHDSLYLRHVRFGVAMGGVAILAFFIFLKQYLLDQRLVELLNRSRQSFDNLERMAKVFRIPVARLFESPAIVAVGERVQRRTHGAKRAN